MIPSLWQKADFPYISVLVTGAHTEIVLTRGVGLHTVMGFSIDIGIGSFLDTVAEEIK
jgi:tRNA A37 threonylcarbamoyltransferase TsaD